MGSMDCGQTAMCCKSLEPIRSTSRLIINSQYLLFDLHNYEEPIFTYILHLLFVHMRRGGLLSSEIPVFALIYYMELIS